MVEADAEQLDHVAARLDALGASFGAVLFNYSLSLMTNWEAAWRQATSLVRPGGRAGIVDMRLAHGWARLLDPAARLAWPVYSVGRISTHVRGHSRVAGSNADERGAQNRWTTRNTVFASWNMLHTARRLKDHGGSPRARQRDHQLGSRQSHAPQSGVPMNATTVVGSSQGRG